MMFRANLGFSGKNFRSSAIARMTLCMSNAWRGFARPTRRRDLAPPVRRIPAQTPRRLLPAVRREEPQVLAHRRDARRVVRELPVRHPRDLVVQLAPPELLLGHVL